MNLQALSPRSGRARAWLAAVLSLLAAGTLAFWLRAPSSYSDGGVSITMLRSGSPGRISFVVRDEHQRPLAGVKVQAESASGATERIITDKAGGARIRPGEIEILAVIIHGRRFRLGRAGVPEFFAPACTRGLIFQVVIQVDRTAWLRDAPNGSRMSRRFV